jgi:O-antigen/teichoic acid export membrane protein
MNLFGPGFSQGATALAILLLIPAISTVSSVAGVALWAVDRPMLSTAITVVRLLLTVPLTIGLTLWAGLTGTALGLLVGWTVDVALMIGAMRKYALGALDVTILRQCVALVVAYAAGFGASRAADSVAAGLSGTFLALATGTFVYVAGLLVTGVVTADDRGRLRLLWRSVRSRRPATQISS